MEESEPYFLVSHMPKYQESLTNFIEKEKKNNHP